jgi:hypothetical protein
VTGGENLDAAAPSLTEGASPDHRVQALSNTKVPLGLIFDTAS